MRLPRPDLYRSPLFGEFGGTYLEIWYEHSWSEPHQVWTTSEDVHLRREAWRRESVRRCREEWGMAAWADYQQWLLDNKLWPDVAMAKGYYYWRLRELPPTVVDLVRRVNDWYLSTDHMGTFVNHLSAEQSLYPYYFCAGMSDVELALVSTERNW